VSDSDAIRSALFCVRTADGGEQEMPWAEVDASAVVMARPWRTFRWYKGQRHYSGFHWSSTERASFSEFGIIGGSAVVLDGCSTASDGWLYDDDDRLRPECQSLLGKPLLGGSGDKSTPQKPHGKWILGELVNVLSGLEDTSMDEDKLRGLLEDVLDRAATRAEEKAWNSTLRKAYKVRQVINEL
jgi:hypothetical protein